MDKQSVHGMWSSRTAFILAAAGSAVGLGNIWRFPYLTSDNGGGAFVLVYLACIAAVGLPILFAEVLIGRHGRQSPINTLLNLARETGHSKAWAAIGVMGMISAILILSFYSVVAGWTLHYSWLYLQQLFGGAGIEDAGATFGDLLASPGTLLFWHSVFMLLTIGVVALGVEKGLERTVRLLMPTLLILLLVLVGYGISTGYFGQAVAFLFTPDFSKVDGSVLLAALGQAFFSLSLGLAGMMAYGAYLPRNVSIPHAGVAIALTDTGIALLAGLAIFPVLFNFGMSPTGGGPGLIFTTLPMAFADMWGGVFYGLAFFGLLTVAAWTSSISLLEPPTAYLVERTELTRRQSALLGGAVVWLLGLLTLLGFNVWSEVKIGGRDLQGAIEFVASDIMLPLGGLLVSLYAGWVLDKRITHNELPQLNEGLYQAWRWTVRVIAPLLVLYILVNKFSG
ncbi:MAG: sodium-dependent transporter [Aquimonas sp.]|nr:sodium-dependent transporter [Aquimonas sp.]